MNSNFSTMVEGRRDWRQCLRNSEDKCFPTRNIPTQTTSVKVKKIYTFLDINGLRMYFPCPFSMVAAEGCVPIQRSKQRYKKQGNGARRDKWKPPDYGEERPRITAVCQLWRTESPAFQKKAAGATF